MRSLRPTWRNYAQTPAHLVFDGLTVFYPRYLQLPGAWFAPGAAIAMALGSLGLVRRLRREGFGVLFAQTTFPDGLTAALLSRWTGLPCTCLGRGSDINRTGRRTRVGRALLAWTIRRTAGVAVVAHDLARALAEVTPEARQATVVYDGIDLESFAPGDRREARIALGLPEDGALVLFVGRLVGGKGLSVLLRSFAQLLAAHPDARLAIVGDGALRAALVELTAALGIGPAVRFAGERPYEEMPRWLAASDVLALPSEAEGFPNVVREALACGRPVVATPVGDIPRVVTATSGRLVPPDDPLALAEALGSVLSTTWDPQMIRDQVRAMSWAQNAADTERFLTRALQATR